MDPGKSRALETTLGTILKRFGEGSIMRLGEATHMQVETIPTGSLALDLALGVGGIPKGRAEIRQHRFQHARIYRRGGVIIEVNGAAHGFKFILPCCCRRAGE